MHEHAANHSKTLCPATCFAIASLNAPSGAEPDVAIGGADGKCPAKLRSNSSAARHIACGHAHGQQSLPNDAAAATSQCWSSASAEGSRKRTVGGCIQPFVLHTVSQLNSSKFLYTAAAAAIECQLQNVVAGIGCQHCAIIRSQAFVARCRYINQPGDMGSFRSPKRNLSSAASHLNFAAVLRHPHHGALKLWSNVEMNTTCADKC